MIHSFKMIGFRTIVNGTNVLNCIKAYPLLDREINELDCIIYKCFIHPTSPIIKAAYLYVLLPTFLKY